MEASKNAAAADFTDSRPVWFTMLYDAPHKGDDTISPDYKLYVAMIGKLVSSGFVNMVHNYLTIPAKVEYNMGKDMYFISPYQEFYDTFNPADDENHRSAHVGQLAGISKFCVVTKQNQLIPALHSIPVVPRSYTLNSPYVEGDNCLAYTDGNGEDLARVLKETRLLLPTDLLRMRKNVVETLLVEREMQRRSDAVADEIREVQAQRAVDLAPKGLIGADGKPLA